jgi:hypothetical protein
MATDQQPPGKHRPSFGSLPRNEALLLMHRSALASAAYHANHESQHLGAPYPLKPLSPPEIVEHFERNPNAALQDHAAAWLLDHPGRASAFAPYVDRLVGAAAAERAREAVASRRDELLDRSVLWRALTDDEGPLLEKRQSRFALAYAELSRARRGPPPGAAGQFGPRSVGAGQAVALPCELSDFHCRVTFDPATQITHCRADVLVNRAANEYNVIADPQNWSVAAYLFFQKSQRCTFADGGFPPLANPPAPGSVPFCGGLHEVVSFSFNPAFPMRGDNVLSVNYQRPGALGESRLDISLDVCVSTSIGPTLQDGGLDVDAGLFSAMQETPDPTTRIAGEKTVRFTSRELCGWDLGPWLNLFAPLWVAPFMGFMIYESACAND